MEREREVFATLYLKITDSRGLSHVESRETWGENGRTQVHASILRQYSESHVRDEADRRKKGEKSLPAPKVEVITKEEYLTTKFGRRAA